MGLFVCVLAVDVRTRAEETFVMSAWTRSMESDESRRQNEVVLASRSPPRHDSVLVCSSAVSDLLFSFQCRAKFNSGLPLDEQCGKVFNFSSTSASNAPWLVFLRFARRGGNNDDDDELLSSFRYRRRLVLPHRFRRCWSSLVVRSFLACNTSAIDALDNDESDPRFPAP